LAFVAPVRGKKGNILRRLARGESVDEIVSAEQTSPAYIHNVRYEQRRKERASSENAPPPPTSPATQDLHPVDTAQPGRVPMEPTLNATPPVPGAETGTTPLATPIEDPVSDQLRLNLIQTRNRVEILRQRRTLAQQNLRLSLEERREREEWEEEQIRLVIFNQCPDPRNMFTNRSLYIESMLRILENVEPFRTVYLQIVNANVAHGFWSQDQTSPMLRSCLAQSFALTDAPSSTLVRDHVIDFLKGLVNPAGGYCPDDHTPVLPLGSGTLLGFCAKYHCWSLSSHLLVRKTELAIAHPIVAPPKELRT
jgi:hypothetical protein